MRIGLIDVDGHNFPNLPLMKLSAYYKKQGYEVEWYDPMFGGMYDAVYMSKVFSFTPDYEYPINARNVIKGGSGYCIRLVDGKEVYDKNKDVGLPYDIEHIFPDYSLYGITDTAYGFLTRGCPRNCNFCHTTQKDGACSVKVADLSEFWNGQKNIILLDQNILACIDSEELLKQLADSKAKVEFNGGLDVRMLTESNMKILKQIKMNQIHFAWNRYEDKNIVLPKLKMFYETFGQKYCRSKVQCYVLTNFNTTHEQDIERVTELRKLSMSPYIMRYDKENIPRGSTVNKLARYCNNRMFFWKYQTFEDYLKGEKR